MLDQFYTGFADTKITDLMRYCKMEHVLPADLARAGKSQKSLKLRLETAVFHLLQRIDKKIDLLISRLTVVIEHHSMVQRHVS